jgi:hypothetical protein
MKDIDLWVQDPAVTVWDMVTVIRLDSAAELESVLSVSADGRIAGSTKFSLPRSHRETARTAASADRPESHSETEATIQGAKTFLLPARLGLSRHHRTGPIFNKKFITHSSLTAYFANAAAPGSGMAWHGQAITDAAHGGRQTPSARLERRHDGSMIQARERIDDALQSQDQSF